MLLQQWYSYQKQPDDDVTTHIVKLENLAHRLQTLSEKIPNQMIITKILITLPPSFKYFISAWESTQPNERTYQSYLTHKSYFKAHH
ncbi:Copia protein [Apis cerana cerana]|uniref:Copia protein n=1 Tax=Apis cerana cerana TaxID=94128 RepID=A0A2A3E271_APICC|nr:Copia protein [Apis cerana cerana]